MVCQQRRSRHELGRKSEGTTTAANHRVVVTVATVATADPEAALVAVADQEVALRGVVVAVVVDPAAAVTTSRILPILRPGLATVEAIATTVAEVAVGVVAVLARPILE
jgi:hypothetical protein